MISRRNPYFSTSDSCSENFAFTSTDSQGILAAQVIFFIVYLVFFVLFMLSRTKSPASRSILTWPFFGLAIIFSFSFYITRLIVLCLVECGSIDFVQYYKGNVAIYVFVHISELLFLVTILVIVASYLQFLAGNNPKLIRIIYSIVAGVFAVITLADVGLNSYTLVNFYEEVYGESEPLYIQSNRLGTAYYAIYLVISIIAVITMIVSLVQMNSRYVASGALKIWIPILSISQIIWTALTVFGLGYWILESREQSEGAAVAMEFLVDFFQAVAFLSVIFIGTSPAIAAGTSQQTYSPVEPAYGVSPEQAIYQPPQQAVYQHYQPYQQQPSASHDAPIYVPPASN